MLTFLRVFQEQTYTTTNQLAVTAVLLENIIFHVGEDYLLNHIELCMVNSVDNLKNGPPAIASLQASSYFASIIDNVLHTSLDQINNISYDWMFVDFDGDLLLFINVLKIFFTSLLQFYKFPIMVECFKRHHLNGHLIDKAMMLPKQITSMATASVVLDAAVTESRDVVRIFAKFLLSIDCSNELWLHAMQRLAEGFEANMLVELLDDICKKYVSLTFVSVIISISCTTFMLYALRITQKYLNKIEKNQKLNSILSTVFFLFSELICISSRSCRIGMLTKSMP